MKQSLLVVKAWMVLCGLLAFAYGSAANPTPATDESRIQTAGPVSKPEIRKLIRQARNGSVEAYETLAACYRDGNGLPQSYFNMFMTYRLACQKTGGDVLEILETLDEEHPFRLLIEMLNHQEIEQIPPESVERLRKVSPADARVFDAIRAVELDKDSKAALRLLRQSESEGSEMACIFHVLVLDHMNDTEGYRKALRRHAKQFPSLYIHLGESYRTDTADKKELRQAVKYYRRADLRGMLSGTDARNLLSACSRLEKVTNKHLCDKTERTRLESLSSND